MSPLSAQEREIEGVIAGQMQAFRDGDVEGAFGFASPGIRRFFGTSERFGAMVRGGYPMVWQPGELRFLELREIAGQLWQKIEIRDAAGGLHWLDYQMIPVGDGWRINAVQILVAPPPSV
ncbi:MAG: DUF4864 domain-containing protein [Marinibacterium sp.]|nr:DUF4864 domain-containing protein [Marinibacterium sp.]